MLPIGSPQKTRPARPSDASNPKVIDVRARLVQARDLLVSGKYAQAEELFAAAAGQARELNNPQLTGRCMSGLGSCRYGMFRYREALNTYLEARQFAEQAEDWANLGTLDGNVSSLYLTMGDLEAAAHAAERAPGELERGGFTHGLALSLIQLGVVLARQGKLEDSARTIGRAIDMADREGNPAVVAEAWDDFGHELLSQHAVQAAEQPLMEAYRLRKLYRLSMLDSSYYNLGNLRLAQGDPQSALRLFDAALDPRHRPDSLVAVCSMYHARGRAYLALDQVAPAFRDFQTALNLARSWRMEVLPADFARVGFEVGLDEIYSSFVETGNRLYFAHGGSGLAKETFRAAEENRAWSLHALEMLPNDWREALPSGYWNTVAQLRAAEVQLLQGETEERTQEMRRLRALVLEMEARAGANPEVSSVGMVARTGRSLPSNAALLSFHLGTRESFLWTVTAERFSLYRLPPKAELAADIRSFSNAVRSGDSMGARLGGDLYRKLFGSVDASVRRKEHWILALDDELFHLPFGALVVANHPGPAYLAERHSLRITSGALTLGAGRGERWSESLSGRLVGVGDAVYNSADPRWKKPSSDFGMLAPWAASAASPSTIDLPRLAASAREIEACARVWNDSATLLKGMNAAPEPLRAEFRRAPSVIHFATHFVPARQAPHYAMIALSLSPAGQPQYLSPLEITRSRIPAGVVVLSGCSSGDADVLPASGLMGLTRAWLAAGARAVLASTWPTPDDGGTLFLRFYEHLRERPEAGPAVALQRAQLDLLRSAGWRSLPQFWATYFVVNDQ